MKIEPLGFREYDARWLFPQQIDAAGLRRVGHALAVLLQELGAGDEVISGHDYRSYSREVQEAFCAGLAAGGAHVWDIGLALSPTSYYACGARGLRAVAMVTASHNENGWTGIKMASRSPLTFGPEEMTRLKALALGDAALPEREGAIMPLEGMAEAYKKDLIAKGVGIARQRKLKLVLACGNGTAGAFAPEVFSGMGMEIIPLKCELDASFPHYNPNPEHEVMMRDVSAHVLATGADMGLAFDGDGDRCGFISDKGEILSPDKVGLLLTRHWAKDRLARVVIDVKSTGLFARDEILRDAGVAVLYGRTGHSYMKRAVVENRAGAGFEKSGHFFLAPPYGRIYDDGLIAGIAVCRLLAETGEALSALYDALPISFISPTYDPFSPDESKYDLVEDLTARCHEIQRAGGQIAGRRITELITLNGVRVRLEDDSWFLVRASSNKPALSIVAESFVSREDMRVLSAKALEMAGESGEIGAAEQGLE